MPYPALPDHRIPYDADGTIVYTGSTVAGATTPVSQANLLEAQDTDWAVAAGFLGGPQQLHFFFFPHETELTGVFALLTDSGPALGTMTGSNDTTNGMDGTWETASLPGGVPTYVNEFSWRSGIKAVSFTGPKKNMRMTVFANAVPGLIHLYGEAAAGQMAHDLTWEEWNGAAWVAIQSPLDYGDQPLGTTVVRQIRLHNTSATRSADNVNVQLNDTDWTIAEDAGGPWVVTIAGFNIAAGANSDPIFVRLTTPAPGAPLQPRFARIVVTVQAGGFFG